jgi:glutathione S-transferase
MYTVIGPTQTRTFRVLWMLGEIGQPFTHAPHAPRSAEVRAYSDLGKVPVLLTEDGVAVTDSTAILTFLADRHGVLTFPAGSLERARQDSLTQFVLDDLDALLWTAARHSFVLPEAQRVPAIKESLKWEFARNTAALAGRLGAGPFLMGDRMTVPDIIATHCLSWARGARFPTENPALTAYVKRLRARPAHRAAEGRTEP